MTWVSVLLASAFIAALVTVVLSKVFREHIRYIAFIASLAPLILASYIWLVIYEPMGNVLLSPGSVELQERVPWIDIAGYSVNYNVGIDGISLPLILLTALLTSLAIMSAWSSIHRRETEFYALILVMEGALIGVFVSLDFILFYVFWEAVLVPMYFLIAIWGGTRRRYASMKFFIYTNLGSLVMFLGVVALYFNSGVSELSLLALTDAIAAGEITGAFGLSPNQLLIACFAALFIGFAVKVPIVPFHTWLPDAHVEAPTPVSVLLAGVLLKLGTYALLRFNFTMMPEVAVQFAWLIAVIGVVSVLYGALLAMAQSDLKRIVAYSSISSMGYVLIGLAAYTHYSVGGATFQMLSHGLISGLMFMVVGVIYHHAHTRDVTEISGLMKRMPVVAGVFIAGAFAYMGLPGMSGFAAEIFVFLGSMTSEVLMGAYLVVPTAMFGVVLVAGYLLYAMQRTLFGEFKAPPRYRESIGEAPMLELLPMLVLLFVIVALGVQPDIAFDMIKVSTESVVELAGGGL